MILYAFALLVCTTTLATCRGVLKGVNQTPTITNSLVNLGKMDISFHFNAKDAPLTMDSWQRPPSTFSYSKPAFSSKIEEPCPCSGAKNFKDSILGNPSDIINKILTNNDLFSFNKEPASSAVCCDSHEHIQEDFVTFDFGPKQMPINSQGAKPLSFSSFLFKDVVPKKSVLPTFPIKQKAMEIFLFPKKKYTPFNFDKTLAKTDFGKKEKNLNFIQIVGDKDLKNDENNWDLRPTSSSSTARNDVTADDNDIIKIKDKEDATKIKIDTTVNKPNFIS